MQLTKSQLACLAAKEWAVEAEKAHIRSGRRTDIFGPSPDEETGQTRNILSKRFGVAARYVQIAKRIMDNDPELFTQIESGEVGLPTDTIIKRKKQSLSFALYRAFDRDGILLYIGITCSVGERMKAHALGSEWWDEFETLKVDRNFTSRIELESAETFAIKNENPKYNILGS